MARAVAASLEAAAPAAGAASSSGDDDEDFEARMDQQLEEERAKVAAFESRRAHYTTKGARDGRGGFS